MAEQSYLVFRSQLPKRKMKTKIWTVHAKSSGDLLGEIKWFPRWRNYCFFPAGLTIWSEGCLEEIQQFLKEHKHDRRIVL